MRFFGWIDRNLWSIPVLVFMATWAGFGLWAAANSKSVLLAAAQPTVRAAVYSSLTSSGVGFFGAALAVVAILVVFPRLASTTIEDALARARTGIVGVLLMSSFFLLTVVAAGTIALAADVRPSGNSVIASLLEASGCASVTGLLTGGLGLALVLVERSRNK
jgi:hypothetical protein